MVSAFAWPLVVLILGIFAIYVFRAPLSRFVDRAQEIGKSGIRATPARQQLPDPAHDASRADQLLKFFDNALLVKHEQAILQYLREGNIENPDDRERILIRFLAGAALAAVFERTYSVIWGSQIAVLEFLNEAAEGGMEIELLRPWYEQAAAQNPALYANYAFEKWLGYLVAASLVSRAGSRASITLEGREFLKFIVHLGYTRFKQG